MNSTDIRELRQRLSLSTQQLADRIGVTRYTINRWESGETKPHAVFVKMLEKLAREARHGI